MDEKEGMEDNTDKSKINIYIYICVRFIVKIYIYIYLYLESNILLNTHSQFKILSKNIAHLSFM